LGHPKKQCSCSPVIIRKYQQKLSGPLLDRIDIHISIPPIDFYKDFSKNDSMNSVQILDKVTQIRSIQKDRFKNNSIKCNSEMDVSAVGEFCNLSKIDANWLKGVLSRLNYSARSYIKILKLSRTIADLSFKENINKEHLSEAIQLRQLDRGIGLN
jgi:magnesium chelatase family protein